MRKKLVFLVILSLGLSIFIYLFPENQLDLYVAQLNIDKETLLYRFIYYMTFLGSKNIIIPFVPLGAAYLFKLYRQIYPGLMLVFGTLLGYLANEGIKALVQRPRPSVVEAVHATGYSFPSGHSMVSFISYFIFIHFLLLNKTQAKKQQAYGLTALLVLLIGLTRLVLHVHYLTDVLGGFLFGMICLLFIFYLFPKTKYLRLKE